MILPEAEFYGSTNQGQIPLAITFIHSSPQGVTSWLWDFGDGQNSQEKQPNHVYNKAGKYSVSLTVIGPGGKSRETKTDYVTATDNVVSKVASNESQYLNWKDAGKYIGQNKTIEGIIVDAYYASTSNGKPTFLNFNIPYKGYFTCLIWGSDRDKFTKVFPPNPETYFLLKHVAVSGLIAEYPQGSSIPEIILKDIIQIKVID